MRIGKSGITATLLSVGLVAAMPGKAADLKQFKIGISAPVNPSDCALSLICPGLPAIVRTITRHKPL